jgi:MFS transporter, FHS family, L-fucose permease
MLIIGMLFFIFGFVTWLNGILIPFMKLTCNLKNETQAFFVLFAFYLSYFFLALPSSWILKKTGLKNGMGLGLLVMAVGAIIFIPAANARSFALFLTGLFVQGTGLSLLQTASNPYISIVGPIESAAKRISIMGICNKAAGIISPLIVGSILLKDATKLENQLNNTTDIAVKNALMDELASRVINPYIIMAVILVLLAFWVRRSALPELDASVANAQPEGESLERGKSSVLEFTHLLLGVLCLFLYVGVEVMAGDAIVIYGKEFGIPLDQTKYFTSFTLVGMLAGYVVGITTIPKIISQEMGLRISAILGVIFTTGALLTHGYVSVAFVAALGLANALMWPAIFPLAIRGLGRFTETGSALLIMGIVGGGVVSVAFGYFKELYNFQWVFFLLMAPSYLYILYYAISGHKAGVGRASYLK